MQATSHVLIKNTQKDKRPALVRDIAIFEATSNLEQKPILTQQDKEPNVEAESYTKAEFLTLRKQMAGRQMMSSLL
jgi:hypothetical protein